jgi:uncharacterized membrane protein (DUF373 family)
MRLAERSIFLALIVPYGIGSMEKSDKALRTGFGVHLGTLEVIIYTVLAILLSLTAFVSLGTAGKLLWDGLSHSTSGAQTLRVLNELLVVLMLVELLYTVRISIRSHVLVTEPFLVVGLIASIRRILVVTLEASTLHKDGAWTSDAASGIFRASMVELGLLAILVITLVLSIILLRRHPPPSQGPTGAEAE